MKHKKLILRGFLFVIVLAISMWLLVGKVFTLTYWIKEIPWVTLS